MNALTAQKTCGVNQCKFTLKWIVETDVVDLLPCLVFEKGGFAGLPRACDQDGWKAGKGLMQGERKLALLVHADNNKTRFYDWQQHWLKAAR
jgi:hypothetical protein